MVAWHHRAAVFSFPYLTTILSPHHFSLKWRANVIYASLARMADHDLSTFQLYVANQLEQATKNLPEGARMTLVFDLRDTSECRGGGRFCKTVPLTRSSLFLSLSLHHLLTAVKHLHIDQLEFLTECFNRYYPSTIGKKGGTMRITTVCLSVFLNTHPHPKA